MKTLLDIIAAVKGCKFAHIEYVSDCKFPKKSGLGNVTKVVTGRVQINYDYTKVVKARLARTGGDANAFVGESLPWGTWEIANKVIAHNGKRYLRYYAMKNSNFEVTYYVDGREATDTEVANIKAYLATKDTKSAKQTACGMADADQVIPRCVEFCNILSLSTDGETWEKQSAAAA